MTEPIVSLTTFGWLLIATGAVLAGWVVGWLAAQVVRALLFSRPAPASRTENGQQEARKREALTGKQN